MVSQAFCFTMLRHKIVSFMVIKCADVDEQAART